VGATSRNFGGIKLDVNTEMHTYFYFPTGRKVWCDLADKLSEEGFAEPSLWLGDPTHDTVVRERFPNAEIVKFKGFTKSRRAPDACYEGSHPEFWFSEEFFRIKERAIKLMDRADPHENFRNVDRDVFFNDLVIWGLSKYETLKPDFVLFSEAPHAASGYVLYEIAKFIGTPVYLFSAWSLMPIMSLRQKINGPFLQTPKPFADSDFTSSFNAVVSNYLGGFANPDNYDFEPRYMKIQQMRDSEKQNFARFKVVLTKLAYGLMLLSRRKRIALRRRRELLAAMNTVVTTSIPNNYVYFPLHYEPERTTNPDGGVFHDQLRTLAHIRSIIPKEMSIVVKEHPSTFTPRLKGHLGRSPAFYEATKKIQNLHIVPMQTSTADLILGAKCIATITGTVALEAAILGRPSLIFGSPWFEGCPGVQTYSDNMDFKAFLGSETATRSLIQDWMISELSWRGIPGCVNPSNERYFAKYYRNTTLSTLELDSLNEMIRHSVSQ